MMTDQPDMNTLLRRAAGYGPPEAEPAAEDEPETPTDFDGGARRTPAPTPPSVNSQLRAAYLAAKYGITTDEALRQVRAEKRQEN